MSYQDQINASIGPQRVGDLQWSADGKPYFMMSNGSRLYLPPAAMTGDLLNDPRAQAFIQANPQPRGGFLHGSGEWDSQTGTWQQHLNGGNLLALGVGSAMAAPFVAGAFGAGAGGSAAGSGSTLAATSTPGYSLLPEVGVSGVDVGAGGAAAGGVAAGGAAAGGDAAASGGTVAGSSAGTAASSDAAAGGSGLLPSTSTPGMSTLPSVGSSGMGGGFSASSLWNQIAKYAGPISAIGGGLIQAHAISSAAAKQQQATEEALALQARMYDTTRSDLMPYNQIGTGALGNLRLLTGLPNPPPASSVPLVPPTAPHAGATPSTPGFGSYTGQQAVPRPGVPGQTAAGSVLMRAPDGTTQQVDPAHVSFYQQKGAQVVS